MSELKELNEENCNDFVVSVNEENVLSWKVILFGPSDSPYAGGHFEVNLS